MENNWRLIAGQCYLGANIYAVGRFAFVACDRLAVYLFASKEQAQRAAKGACHLHGNCKANHEVRDLKPCPMPRKCSDSFGYE